MQTKGAIGNLLNRYRAVLKKCHVMNVFGSLALASMFVLSGAAAAQSMEIIDQHGADSVGQLDPGASITDSTFRGNVVEVSSMSGQRGRGGVFHLEGHGQTGGITISNSAFEGNSITSAQGYPDAKTAGAAFFAKGITVNLNDVQFSNNKVTCTADSNPLARGGAIYADADFKSGPGVTEAVINFNVSKDMTYSGNTVESPNGAPWVSDDSAVSKSSGGFLFLHRNSTANFNIAEGATLTIGEAGASGNMDSIASSSVSDASGTEKNSTVVKQGAGTLTVNSSLNDYYGNLAVRQGTMNVTQAWDVKGEVTVSGGATLNLTATNLTKADAASAASADESTQTAAKKAPARRLAPAASTLNTAGASTLAAAPAASADTSASETSQDASNTTTGSLIINGGTVTVAMPDKGGVSAGEGESLLALGQTVTVGENAKLHVGTVSNAEAAVAFGPDSILVVDGNVSSQQAMIKGSGAMAVDDGSKLYVANAKAGTKYIITDGLTRESYWKNANLLANRAIQGTVVTNGDEVIVTTEAADISTSLPGVIPATALSAMTAQGLNNTESDSMGVRFLSRAIEPLYIADDKTAVNTINEVSRAAVMAGVQNTSLRLADAASDNVLHHLSLGSFDSGNSIHKDGVDVWATPMYGNTYSHGMNVSDDSVVGNYGGLAIGFDTEIGSFGGGNMRLGLAVHGGAGRSESQGAVTSTDNNYNFGGANIYAGWNRDSLNIMASVGYSIATHKLNMDLPSSLEMGDADADVHTGAFTAELRGEYQFKTDWLDIMPHTGVRYTALHTYGYDLEVDDRTLNSVDDDMQNIVQFPTGVTLTKNFTTESGWNIKPQFDASIIPAVGQLKTNTKVTYSGIDAEDSIHNSITDTVSWAGMAGIQFEKGDFAIGANYAIQAAAHETDQRVALNLVWKF